MSRIIEKLGITPFRWEGICLHDDGCKCGYIFNEIEACIGKAYFNDPKHDGYIEGSEIVTLEQARNNQRVMSSAPEMLEALILIQKFHDEIDITGVIEKATGKTWEQIKELL